MLLNSVNSALRERHALRLDDESPLGPQVYSNAGHEAYDLVSYRKTAVTFVL